MEMTDGSVLRRRSRHELIVTTKFLLSQGKNCEVVEADCSVLERTGL